MKKQMTDEEAHSLWVEYCKSGRKPKNIPARPDQVYAGQGWRGWADWVGSVPLNHGINIEAELFKAELLELARQGAFRPTGRLGEALTRFTTPPKK